MIITPLTLTLYEGVGTTGTLVSLTEVDAEIVVEDVEYIHPLGDTYEDMVINLNANTFTFSSKFQDSFNRTIWFLEKQINNTNVYDEVKGPNFLPEVYAEVYRVNSPPDTTQVHFNIDYRIRYMISTEPIVWSEWTYHTANWSLTLKHDWEYTHEVIQNTVANGIGV